MLSLLLFFMLIEYPLAGLLLASHELCRDLYPQKVLRDKPQKLLVKP